MHRASRLHPFKKNTPVDIEFSFGKQDRPGHHSAYVAWSATQGVTRRLAYETASTIFESLVCWKGWPHLDATSPLPERGWTHTMETVEGDGVVAERHVLTFVFESMLDQIQFVAWWDTQKVELEDEAAWASEEASALDDLPVLDAPSAFDEWPLFGVGAQPPAPASQHAATLA